MVSHFIPRGRFLIKSVNLRQNPKEKKGPTRWTFRRAMSSEVDNKVPLIDKTTKINFRSSTGGGDKSNNNQYEDSNSKRSGWFSWTGLLFRWAPMGFCLFGALDWQLQKYRCNNSDIPRIASTFQTNVYCSLPLRILSRCWGWLAECYIPTALRPYVYGWYSNAFFVNINEAKNPNLKDYRSLSEFFTRPLREGARCIDSCDLVSPADGRVLHFGTASTSLIEQVKGVTYSIESFLGPETWTEPANGATYLDQIKHDKSDKTALFQCVVYLAPGDYHRFHSPVEWEPTLRRHFPGELLSVNPKIANWLPGLFCLNERALYVGKWKHGFFSFTAVGATNVGSVQIYFDEELKTNQWIGLRIRSTAKENFAELQLPKDTQLKKGELLGQFNMGSTVVLLFEAPKEFQFNITAGQTIRVGEPLGFVRNEASSSK